ncbi:MAG: dipeptidase [Phycisphaerae bacterium]
MDRTTDDWLQRAQTLHKKTLVIDTHCDTTQRLADPNWDFAARHETGHIDLPRAREGGLSGAFFAIWASGPVEPGQGAKAAQAQMDRLIALTRTHADAVTLASTPDEILHAHKRDRFAVVPAMEGGYLIEDSIELLRSFRKQGVTYMTLTHGFHTSWADSAGIHTPLPPHHGGLTAFGRDVVREMNRMGMMVDVSHASDACVSDVLDTSSAPVMASHSSCRAVSPHPRNLPDELIQEIARRGGVVQINFAAGFIDPNYPKLDPKKLHRNMQCADLTPSPPTDHKTPLSILADHFDHAIELVGPEHVGIGSDFDGIPHLPDGLDDCSKLPRLTAALMQRGHHESDLVHILGLNALRVMRTCQQLAED